MSSNLGILVSGDRQVSLKFDRFPEELHDVLLKRIGGLLPRLAARVRNAMPSKTGAMRRKVATGLYDDAPKKISGRVYVSGDYAKAGAQEYGAHRLTKVGSHVRTLNHVFGNRLTTPVTVLVEAYSRRPNIMAQRFIRGTKASMETEIDTVLEGAVSDLVEQAS